MTAPNENQPLTEPAADKVVKTVGVIEIGTTSIRMVIAEITQGGAVRQLENLQQAVMLGRDTFTKGELKQETIEECVKVLRSFKQVLDQYQISDARDITAVATSAVREAANKDAILDRIYIATGINVTALDDAEIGRFNYLAVQPVLKMLNTTSDVDTIVLDVGGGNTDLLLLKKGRVISSQVFRVGSYRLKKMMEDYRAPATKMREILNSYVDRAVAQIHVSIEQAEVPLLLALGGDTRIAASQLVPGWDKKDVAKVQVSALSKFANDMIKMGPDEIVKKYHVSYPEAETLVPALLVYVRLAEVLHLKNIVVGTATMRDGIVIEMATHGSWTEEFKQQIINSAYTIGKKYEFDRRHAENVASLAGQIFTALKDEHGLGARYELIMTLSSLLHEIGHYISNRSHHKHSMYLIMNSDIFGISPKDLMLSALVARYHRRALPKPTHEYYSLLDRDDRVIVAKLASILRIADALDRGHSMQDARLNIKVDDSGLNIILDSAGDLTLETHGIQEKGAMFKQVYGMKIVLHDSKESR